MADGTNYSNSIRAGAFLVTSVIVALFVVVVLSKSSMFTRKNDYVVRFTMSEGVAGIAIGSEVRVSGLKVGRVTAITQRFDEDRIDVAIEMSADIPVYQDAAIIRAQPLLGNYSWLNFSSLGTSEKGKIDVGGHLDARPSGGLLATIVGPQNASRANEMFINLVTFTASLDDFARKQYPENVVPMLKDAKAAVGTLRTDYETWRPDISSGLASASSAMHKLDATMDDAQAGVKDARTILAHFRETNLKQLDELLDSGLKGANRFASAMEQLDTELVARIPDVRVMLSDLRQSAAQVKLATMEVRRSPWKLLYRPSGDELARENLYEAARAFAIASSDLRVAGDTLRATMKDTPQRFAEDAKFRDAIRTQVLQSVDRFDAAQRKLFDVLQADFKEDGLPAVDVPAQPPITLPAKDAPTPAVPAAAAH
jgi:MlaD protein